MRSRLATSRIDLQESTRRGCATRLPRAALAVPSQVVLRLWLVLGPPQERSDRDESPILMKHTTSTMKAAQRSFQLVSYRSMSSKILPSVKQAKSELRKYMRKKLESVSNEEIKAQSGNITKKVWGMPEYQNAKALSIFLSMPIREVATRSIVLQSLEDGKLVFVPYIYKNANGKFLEMEMLQLLSKEDFESLKHDPWGIPILSEDSLDGRRNALGGTGIPETSPGPPILDVIFTPALVFDQSLGRLGHGKGCYDYYLKRYEKMVSSSGDSSKMPKLIGLALRQQVLTDGATVPSEGHDRKLDQVIVGEL